MRFALAALFLLLALTVGLLVRARPAEPGTAPRTVPARPGPAHPPAGADPELVQLRDRVALLDQRVDSLSGELELLRTQLQRRPAEVADVSASEALPDSDREDELNAAQRREIADILARAREQEAALRAEERAAREEQMVLDRAGRIAELLGLATSDQALLADHLRSETERRREIIERSRQADYDREVLRDELVALGDWSEQHLIDTFGADLAARIRAAERETRGASLDRGAGLDRAGRPRRER